MQEKLNSYLMPNEQVLEVFKPNSNKLFASADLFLVPFSIFWAGFALFWECTAILTYFAAHTQEPVVDFSAILFPIFGIPFILVGLHMLVGRFIFKKWNKENTVYAITDKRIVRLSKTIFGNLKFSSKFIDRIEFLSVKDVSQGLGTVAFDRYVNHANRFYENTGMEIFSGVDEFVALFDIPNAEAVYNRLMELRQQLLSPIK